MGNIQNFLVGAVFRFLALMPALTFHEFAHAYSAYRLGDPTPKMDGRISLNPLDHLDPLGTLMILFAPIGWAKPVNINPANFRNREKGVFISSAVGPLSNLLQGTFWGLVLRVITPAIVPPDGLIVTFVWFMTLINFALALFNLIPLGPLDGHSVLEYFLPPQAKMKFRQLNRYGMPILVGLILVSFVLHVPILGYVIVRPAKILTRLASGM